MMTKKWQPYPTYKDSGVEWLGAIPEHWEVKKLKYISYLTMGQSPSSDDYNHEGYGSPFLQGNAEFGNRNPEAKIFCATVNKYAEKGDILISVRAPVGALNEADRRYGIGRGLCSIRPRDIIIREFAWYLIQVVKVELNFLSTGSTYEAVALTDVSNLSCLLPPLPEQQKIAEFLDQETSKIDKLITKKERLIELLKEKRTALISHAVTKGLNPDVPMKDSGVEWLGEIPEHWKVLLLKRIANIRYGLGQPPPEILYGTPLIRATNVKSGRIFQKDMIYIDPKQVPESRNAVLAAGEIIVVRSGAYTGDSALIPEEYHGSIAGYDMVTTVKEGSNQFIAWQLLSSEVRYIQFAFHQLRAAQPHLNAEELRGTIITFPPLPEQQKIAQFLDRETSKIDNLITKTRTSIDHLKEYRTALISAAVTGKIDVREH
ncbi:MAG: restriction endonuclease subunit S [Microcystis sp.]|jgi:type I restriction enzyme S subunit|uniref:restriction endonuclease subunit S n=3 Tax=Microcystis TaxID=1125 RepID=UPI0022CB149A|nr:restriction endonuclease subunit S [Microcystis sp. 49638_E5]MCE2667805.1 restriction endonuclease subunit S [Microcystis sp. 49638_E5]MCZ8054685.1 restriction endonuclease subunit S [Microcystis sp. LE19-12.2C]MDJ0547874.1 restriction endonuclease subunit S [Microcystis sp. M49637_WE12]